MNFEDFAERLQADLEQRLAGLAEVTRVSFLHNNGTESPSLCVRLFGRHSAPGLNLKNLYAYYQSGAEWNSLLAETLKMIRSETGFEFLQEESFLWENIRDGLNTKEKLVQAMMDYYDDLDEEVARKDLDEFLEEVKFAIEEDEN